MILTSDGKSFVYCVFSADGHECEFLEGIFHDQDSADKAVQELKQKTSPYVYGDPDLLSVKCLEVGRLRDVLAEDGVIV